MKSTYKNPWFWAFVLIVALIIFKSCNKGDVGYFGCNKGDTLSHKIDTVIRIIKSDTQYIPKHDTSYVPKWYQKTVIQTETEYVEKKGTEYEEPKNPCEELEKDYNTPKYYNDTLELKHGTVTINDIVNNNMIMSRKVGLEVLDTSTKETTTILKHKIVVYLGFKAFGMQSDFFHQAEINLGMRGKNDMEYTVGIGKIRGLKQNVYSFEVKLPIRLFTRKK